MREKTLLTQPEQAMEDELWERKNADFLDEEYQREREADYQRFLAELERWARRHRPKKPKG